MKSIKNCLLILLLIIAPNGAIYAQYLSPKFNIFFDIIKQNYSYQGELDNNTSFFSGQFIELSPNNKDGKIKSIRSFMNNRKIADTVWIKDFGMYFYSRTLLKGVNLMDTFIFFSTPLYSDSNYYKIGFLGETMFHVLNDSVYLHEFYHDTNKLHRKPQQLILSLKQFEDSLYKAKEIGLKNRIYENGAIDIYANYKKTFFWHNPDIKDYLLRLSSNKKVCLDKQEPYKKGELYILLYNLKTPLKVYIYNAQNKLILQKLVKPKEEINFTKFKNGQYLIREATTGLIIGKIMKE